MGVSLLAISFAHCFASLPSRFSLLSLCASVGMFQVVVDQSFNLSSDVDTIVMFAQLCRDFKFVGNHSLPLEGHTYSVSAWGVTACADQKCC